MISAPFQVHSRQLWQWFITCAAFVFLFIVLLVPVRLAWITLASFLNFPLELIVVCLVLLVPGLAGRGLRYAVAVLLAIGLVLKIADLVTYQVFLRPFNPVFDGYLLVDGMRLLVGTVGRFPALVVALLLLVVLAGIFWLMFIVLGHIQTVLRRAPVHSTLLLVALLLVWGGLKLSGWPHANAYFHDQVVLHASTAIESIADMKTFRASVDRDDFASAAPDTLFSKLRGKDVFIVFAESYGRAALEGEAFAPGVIATLERSQQLLDANGLQARTAYLTSPTVGGLSWLAHGTALSGLWINNQLRYQSLLMSERATLNSLFQRAGWRTVAAMPAISMAWPEGKYFGYDEIYDAHNFGYAGLPFNWVTMPDQYVLAELHKRERDRLSASPVMAEVALISSHAPWTPIPTMVAWDEVGDGSIFNVQARSGPTPDEVWKDIARIREHYRLAIEYMITNLVSYAVNYGDEDLVLLILGDHQPAPLVSGDSVNTDVPVHLIAADPAVFDAIAEWQWSEGLLPAEDVPVWRMDSLRDRFIQAFSGPEICLRNSCAE